ncbi:MAG TPA: aldehyde dehydrogenase family protein, partial [Desulfobacterales bacterium]|nr:aldehyde dehydrogenase family protein [Desulfobacterales bacterium]
MKTTSMPDTVNNWIDGVETAAADGGLFDKRSPASGELLCRGARSRAADVDTAVEAAKRAYPAWAGMTPVQRGDILMAVVRAMQQEREALAAIVAAETGMAPNAALGETGGAIAQGEFMAGEGRRLYGRTTTSAVANKYAMTVRQPLGVAGLIIAANTPIANVAWKVFPALICGNTAVLKAAEDTPATAWFFGKLAHAAGLPAGVLNIVQGLGAEAGAPLVAHPEVAVVSFTGSTAVGRQIAEIAGRRLAKVSLELGGKNPLVVCDDADLEHAVRWVLLSAFSNAGQRCAAGSRIIIFDTVYDAFRDLLVARTQGLRVGPGDEDDLGPVINERQLADMLAAVAQARTEGATILAGGHRLTGPAHAGGCYMAPTLIENVDPQAAISTRELFGPITCLYRVADFAEALRLANDSPYGLTA